MGKKRFKKRELKMAFCETVSCNYFYRFVCESCDHETKWFPVEITGKGNVLKKDYTILEDKEKEKLIKKAEQNLKFNINLIKEGINKGDYEAYEDRCPNCRKKQSWSLKNRGWEVILFGTIFFISWMCITRLPLVIDLIPEDIYNVVTNFGLLFSFFIGVIVGFLHRANRRKILIDSVEDHKLEFDWAQAGHADQP